MKTKKIMKQIKEFNTELHTRMNPKTRAFLVKVSRYRLNPDAMKPMTCEVKDMLEMIELEMMLSNKEGKELLNRWYQFKLMQDVGLETYPVIDK